MDTPEDQEPQIRTEVGDLVQRLAAPIIDFRIGLLEQTMEPIANQSGFHLEDSEAWQDWIATYRVTMMASVIPVLQEIDPQLAEDILESKLLENPVFLSAVCGLSAIVEDHQAVIVSQIQDMIFTSQLDPRIEVTSGVTIANPDHVVRVHNSDS